MQSNNNIQQLIRQRGAKEHNPLNEKLMKLSSYLAHAESKYYDPQDNQAWRSLKNVGVWLTLYALTDDNQKKSVADALVGNDSDALNFIDELSRPHHLKQLIEDCEAAGGVFSIVFRQEVKERV